MTGSILEYEKESNLTFELDNNLLIGECINISETRSRCILIANQSGKIITASDKIEIIEIKASVGDGYIAVHLQEQPIEFSISSGYPNPFNPVIQFDYSIPVASDVLVQVYDINGRVISTLENSLKDYGSYSAKWNADGYSSGIYFIKFNINDLAEIQKVTLVK